VKPQSNSLQDSCQVLQNKHKPLNYTWLLFDRMKIITRRSNYDAHNKISKMCAAVGLFYMLKYHGANIEKTINEPQLQNRLLFMQLSSTAKMDTFTTRLWSYVQHLKKYIKTFKTI
jgi:hypothetical protein